MAHLLYLHSLLSVYPHKSISRAAERLHLALPAVSRHIKLLEAQLNQNLFERLPRTNAISARMQLSDLSLRVK
jgi:DNA-binding transcriptional LysR family regulator